MGIKLLTKANIPQLQTLSLRISFFIKDSCKVGDEGLTHLIKANWKKLAWLSIGNKFYIVSKE